MEMNNVYEWSLQIFDIYRTHHIKFVNTQIQVIDERHNVPNKSDKYQLTEQIEIHNRHAAQHLYNIDQNNSNVRVKMKR